MAVARGSGDTGNHRDRWMVELISEASQEIGRVIGVVGIWAGREGEGTTECAIGGESGIGVKHVSPRSWQVVIRIRKSRSQIFSHLHHPCRPIPPRLPGLPPLTGRSACHMPHIM